MRDADRVIEAICTQQWAITEEWLRTIIAVADRSQSDMAAVLQARGQRLANTDGVTIRNGIAVLPVRGPIFRYANMFTQISGATSIDSLAVDFGEAAANPAVKAIVLEIDSPGGMVAGVSEFAAQVRQTSAAKPVVAYVSDMGASAAYWIAAAASEVVIRDTAVVGSIGVVMQVSPSSADGAFEFVSSQSPNKRLNPASEAGARAIQSHVDALAQVFIDSVAGYRGVSVAKVQSDFGQGGVLVGAAAVAAGLADRLGALESIITGLSGTQPVRGSSMTLTPATPLAFSEERTRSEYRASPALQAEFGKEEFYVAFMRAESAGRSSVHAGAGGKSDAPRAAAGHGSSPAMGEPASPDEAQCRAEYETDATLRADFPTFTSYLAYARAYHAGRVRIAGANRHK